MKRRDALMAALPLLAWANAPRAASAPTLPDDAVALRLRRGQLAVLLRHAITDPGIGDPPEFEAGACATQRNLSADGRAQAQRIGAWFEKRGLAPSRVRSSAWCRCIDTGTLAFGQASPWPALNSVFDGAGRRDHQSAELGTALPDIAAGQFEIWVTHQVNVTALTGELVQMGEACLVERATASAPIRVIGRFNAGG